MKGVDGVRGREVPLQEIGGIISQVVRIQLDPDCVHSASLAQDFFEPHLSWPRLGLTETNRGR